ncbi:hypothetical protein BCR33DRAFT_715316 [Rhizoclosmatium globosum]|uniref:Mid2 domain-containing protein n=1 Tax=Rhizoclosmatium globosum TaxID=329046 RepID=A0A1Y2CIY3_9FUNG|nr:hypothetical protein BCR33DRAFT_715316 [Rhizoclosmatium globosum]|eukprot:ORY46916.1 hypothetical protein BCR33DRAFT_715316 [Rhizoclosmatium globosum]
MAPILSTKVETTAGILESAVRVSSQSSNVAAQTTTETSTQQPISILTASRIEPRTPEEPLVHTSVLPDSPSLLPIPEDVVIANPSTQEIVQSASLARTMFVPGVENNVPVPSAAQNVSQQLNTSNSNSVVTPVASGLGALLIVVGIIGAVIYRRKSGLKIMKANSDTVSIRNTCNSNIFLGNSLRVASPEPEPHRDSGFFHPFTIDETIII